MLLPLFEHGSNHWFMQDIRNTHNTARPDFKGFTCALPQNLVEVLKSESQRLGIDRNMLLRLLLETWAVRWAGKCQTVGDIAETIKVEK